MKIIIRDNFDREGPGSDDREVVLRGLTREQARKIAAVLQDVMPGAGMQGNDYYAVVEDDYVLREFKP